MTGSVQVLVILASAMTVLLGLIAVTRALFKAAVDIRDNKNATIKNTEALKDLASHVDGRMDKIESWIMSRDTKWKRGNSAI